MKTQFSVRLSSEDKKKLDELKKRFFQNSMNSTIEFLIRKEYQKQIKDEKISNKY